jgi:hypothetical protein
LFPAGSHASLPTSPGSSPPPRTTEAPEI